VWIKRNKILFLLVILLLSGLIASGCIRGSQPVGWSGGVVADGTLFLGSTEGKLVAVNIADGTSQWSESLQASGATGRFGCAAASAGVAIYGTPAVAGDLVYIGGYNGKIYAFDSGSLQKRWVYPPEGNLQPIIGGTVVALGNVYFSVYDSDDKVGKVYALKADTGVKVWESSPAGDEIWSTPVIDGETIYISSFDKKLYALNAVTGEKKWETVEIGGALAATPLVDNNTVYFGSFDRYLYAVDAGDGSLKWKSEVEAGSWFWAKPIIYNNTVYAPSLDGKVYILDADNGRELVDAIDLENPVSSAPVLVNGLIIIASEEGRIYSLDTADNQIKPLADVEEKVNAPLWASNGVVYVHAQGTEILYALNAETGGKLWDLSLSSE